MKRSRRNAASSDRSTPGQEPSASPAGRGAASVRQDLLGNQALQDRLPPQAQGIPHQAEVEQALGADLSGVDVHTGAGAALGDSGAEAATIGGAVYFRDADPSPEVAGHEYAHVLQMRKGGGTGPLAKAPGPRADAPLEREADAAGAAAAEGRSFAVLGHARDDHALFTRVPTVSGNPINPLIQQAYDILDGAFRGMVPRSVMSRISSRTGTTVEVNGERVPFVRFQDGTRGENRGPRLVEGDDGHYTFEATEGVTIDREEGHMTRHGENLYDLAHELVHLAASGDWVLALLEMGRAENPQGGEGATNPAFRDINEGVTDWLTRYAFLSSGRQPASSRYNTSGVEWLVRDVGPTAVARLHFLNDQQGFRTAARGRYGSVSEAIRTWFGAADGDRTARVISRQQDMRAREGNALGDRVVRARAAPIRRGGDWRATGRTVSTGTTVTLDKLSPDGWYGFIARPVASGGWVALSDLQPVAGTPASAPAASE